MELRMCTACAGKNWVPSNGFMHGLFLCLFIVFLIVSEASDWKHPITERVTGQVGVSLTCLGFLDYQGVLGSSKSLRVLGVTALLLCIGFLIAACGDTFLFPWAVQKGRSRQ